MFRFSHIFASVTSCHEGFSLLGRGFATVAVSGFPRFTIPQWHNGVLYDGPTKETDYGLET